MQLVLAAASSFYGICQKGVVRRPKVVQEDPLRLALRRAVWMRKKAVIGWIACLLLWLVVRMQRPHAAGRSGFFSSGLSPAHQVNFWLLPVCLYSISCCYSTDWGKYFCTREVPLLDINDEILHYTLKRNF